MGSEEFLYFGLRAAVSRLNSGILRMEEGNPGKGEREGGTRDRRTKGREEKERRKLFGGTKGTVMLKMHDNREVLQFGVLRFFSKGGVKAATLHDKNAGTLLMQQAAAYGHRTRWEEKERGKGQKIR